MSDWYQRNLPCIECGSSDAMQESEHHFKCFSCNKVFLKKDMCRSDKHIGADMSKNPDLIDIGNYYDLKKRGITEKTCRKFNITCVKYTGSFGHGDKQHYVNDSWCYVFNTISNNSIIKQKVRRVDEKKDQKQFGDTTSKEMFGQSAFNPDSSRSIVITEGEFDSAVVWQETGYNAISTTCGHTSLLKDIVNNFDYLSKYKDVIIGLDNDDVANETVKKFLESDIPNKLGPGKLRIAKWAMKDANELLLAGRAPDIKRAIWDAEEYKPEDLFTAEDFLEESLKDPEMGLQTPWVSLTNSIMGWGENTVNTVAAADGIGKTEVVDEIIHKAINDGVKVWLYSSEQSGSQTFRRQAGKAMNLPLHIPGVQADKELIKKHILNCNNKIIVWKPKKLVTTSELIERMTYVSVAQGVKLFIIDHLKGIEAQMSDTNREMSKLLAELKLFVDSHKCSVILMSHVAKDKRQGKLGKDDDSWNRGRIPTKENIYGSSAIAAWSDVIIVLSRNVEAENPDEACVTRLSILKKRLMGNRGLQALYLKYIEDSGRLVEIEQIDYEQSEER